MRKPLIAGNWKMNGNRGLAAEMLQAMESSLDQTSADVVVCPPFSLLQSVGECLKKLRFSSVHRMFMPNFQVHTLVKSLRRC